ncbi:hypothetical protein TIFTF001_041900 [Ficus carica]|uniref:Uncharacterized protein n=1 Tax=Ficus carica TaxID=3494 RepID=A0AA88CWS0_FICCA|nr:hypothetical protein TIFTF001_041900 [Ficus carica]
MKGEVMVEIECEGERERCKREWMEESQWRRWVSRERLEAREKEARETIGFRRE